jgi:hypothetical protein
MRGHWTIGSLITRHAVHLLGRFSFLPFHNPVRPDGGAMADEERIAAGVDSSRAIGPENADHFEPLFQLLAESTCV